MLNDGVKNRPCLPVCFVDLLQERGLPQRQSYSAPLLQAQQQLQQQVARVSVYMYVHVYVFLGM
jgi:hypothetical protein